MPKKKAVDFYFQVKGLEDGGGMSRWSWPPLLSGKVNAVDKKSARAQLEEELKQTLPLRVLKSEEAPFILSLREIMPDDTKTLGLFVERQCVQCNSGFKIIDKYNDAHATDKGGDYCSYQCREFHQANLRLGNAHEDQEGNYGYIYKITNRHSQQCYIGKTTQSFTLRWYQHFFHGKDTKFSRAIKDSSPIDWIFELIEEVTPADVLGSDGAKAKPSQELRTKITTYISIREQVWINHYNSILEGYNTAPANKEAHEAHLTSAQQDLPGL